MNAFEIAGLFAASLTTISFVPQVLHTLRRGTADDISALWLVSFSTGIALWFVYGLWLNATPVIAANAVTFLLLMIIVWMKFAPRRAEREIA